MKHDIELFKKLIEDIKVLFSEADQRWNNIDLDRGSHDVPKAETTKGSDFISINIAPEHHYPLNQFKLKKGFNCAGEFELKHNMDGGNAYSTLKTKNPQEILSIFQSAIDGVENKFTTKQIKNMDLGL